jgi:hypothetical protein
MHFWDESARAIGRIATVGRENAARTVWRDFPIRKTEKVSDESSERAGQEVLLDCGGRGEFCGNSRRGRRVSSGIWGDRIVRKTLQRGVASPRADGGPQYSTSSDDSVPRFLLHPKYAATSTVSGVHDGPLRDPVVLNKPCLLHRWSR